MRRLAIGWAAVLLVACGGDDSSETSFGEGPTTTMPATTAGTAETGTETQGTGSTAGTSPTTSNGSESSTTTGPACDPVVKGGWNSCIDENGSTDNTLCMWMGTGDSVGIVSCLNSSRMDGANVCFINGCEDECDCFAPPATGNATVICGPIVEGGEMGCGLDCGQGQTCPDGMICAGGLCFWPP